MRESLFQRELKRELAFLFPGCVIMKSDANDIQGLPDLIILYRNRWAALEVKRSERSPVRPNQAYYVELLDNMSFSAFISPENKEEVLDALQQSFQS